MSSHHVPVETEVGIISGRDAIYLDSFSFEPSTNKLSLRGSINGALCSNPQRGFVDYELIFESVLCEKMTELDSFGYSGESSFDEMINSAWISSLGGKITSDYRHFIVRTYDYIIEVACRGYLLIVLKGDSLKIATGHS